MFAPPSITFTTPLDFLMMGVALLAVMLWLTLMRRPRKDYNATDAWLRGGIYFCVCWLLSWLTGVLQTLLSRPLITNDNLQDTGWILFTLFCIVLEIVAYGVIWAKGTLSHGRPRSLLTVLVFGGLWGLSEGQLFLVFWAILERFITSPVLLVTVTFGVIATFNGLWHSLYWDIYVAPEHNILEWNIKKVLFCHVPNLAFTLSYVALYGSVGMFVVFQTISLMLSVYHMRFLPFWAQNRANM
jgi:hypothetical protein